MYDKLFWTLLDQTTENQFSPKYPPYDIVSYDQSHGAIRIALAGFHKSDIEISKINNFLIIETGDDFPVYADDAHFHHRGISARSFKRTFRLDKNVEIGEVTFENGMLEIPLFLVVPEEEKPKKIAIKDSTVSAVQQLNG